MKKYFPLILWAVMAVGILVLAANPRTGVIYHSPVTTLALGLIGLGLCLDAGRRMAKTDAQKAKQ
jgi:hypothetical protein